MSKTFKPRSEYLPFFEPQIGDAEIAEVVDTLRSNWITTGPKTRKFEGAFADYIGASGALSANSWTAAAHTALMALGVGPGDEVITSVMTFCATANIIEHVGAKPVLVDVEPDTLNLDPAHVAEKVTDKTKVIMPVHYAGHPAEMDTLEAIASKCGIKIVEDAAHALPASYKGRMIGSGRNLVGFSFYATKNLTTSEGGMLTGDADFLERARIFTLHGMSNNAWNRYDKRGTAHYEVVTPGFKYNMTDIQASLGLHQLQRLAEFQNRRRSIVERYNDAFSDHPALEIPTARTEVEHAWHLYVIRLNLGCLSVDRDRISAELKLRNIGTSLHFIPIHLHPFYRDKYGYAAGDFAVAYDNYLRLITLPLHPGLSDADVDDVIAAVLDTVGTFHRSPSVSMAVARPASAGEAAAPKVKESRKPHSDHPFHYQVYLSPPHMTGGEQAALADALASRWIAPVGPSLIEFENRLAGRLGLAGACGVSSGTAALHLALRALGVGPGDTVLCPTFSFVAAANPVMYLGAKPVFIDSEPRTWNMDPDVVAGYLQKAARANKLPKALVVADIYGQCADFDALRQACDAYRIPIVEDAAEALGATYFGRPAGALGDISALSFNGNKIITTSGGGMVLSNRRDWLAQIHSWANQAKEPGLQYLHREMGYNYRLSNILAALGVSQLKGLDQFISLKRKVFERYREAFADLPFISWMPEPDGWHSTRWLSCLLLDKDACSISALELCQYLHEHHVEARPLWKPLHRQQLYRDSEYYGGNCAEGLAARGLALPSGRSLTAQQQDLVIKLVREALAGRRR